MRAFKYILCSLFILLQIPHLLAQEHYDEELWVVYIAHDRTTDVTYLTDYLKRNYITPSTRNKKIKLVFYYPNGTKPYIVKINTFDANKSDYEEQIISSLYGQVSQTIYAHVDLEEYLRIFDETDFVSKDGVTLNYSKVKFDFIVAHPFLELGYGRSIIEKLFFALDLQQFKKAQQELSFNILCEKDITADYSSFFGEINYDKFKFHTNYSNYYE